MGIRYKKEDIDKLLFTELVFGMRQDDGNVFRDEIFRRLRFCGFDDSFIKEMIEYEDEIINVTRKEYDKYFYKTKYWIDLDDDEKLIKGNIDDYALYIDGKMSKKAFTTSELIGIYDEADFIMNYGSGLYDSHLDEIEMLYGDSKYNLLEEFKNRIGYIYYREFGKDYDEYIDTCAARFYKNESHILFINKYDYAKDKRGNWKPYSDEFFKYYN